MKQYARDAIDRHGRASYVIDDKCFYDRVTDELYMRVQPVTYTPRELTDKLATGTFSLSAKFYPRRRPSAPDRSPRPVIIERSVTFLPTTHNQVERITDRLSKPTFAHKVRTTDDDDKTRNCNNHLHVTSDGRTRRTLHEMIQLHPKHQRASTLRSVPAHEATRVRFRSAKSYIS